MLSQRAAYLGAELLDAFVIFLVIGDFLADGETLKESFQILRNQLLTGVAQSAGRVAVRLDHQSVETEIHRPLGQFLKTLPGASHVARVGEEREHRVTGAQIHGHLPARQVPVRNLLRGGEPAMDDT